VAVNDLGWCLCSLMGNNRIYLGAETADYLLPRLLDAVDGRPGGVPPSGEIAGRSVHWALSLSEAHHALYYADYGPQRLLFWQNAQQAPVTLVGTITLSPEQRRQWRAQLEAFLNNPPKNGAHQAAITKEIAEYGAEALK
ncbi:MAG: hypothetical protein M3Y28_05525, partial [Armatimonadota bacterium]|nr:hypothetical protein [Armatimonadota bacterium]